MNSPGLKSTADLLVLGRSLAQVCDNPCLNRHCELVDHTTRLGSMDSMREAGVLYGDGKGEKEDGGFTRQRVQWIALGVCSIVRRSTLPCDFP